MLFFFKRVYTCSHMALSNWGDFAPLTAAHWVSVFEQGSVIDLPVLRIKAMFGYPGSDVRMVFFLKNLQTGSTARHLLRDLHGNNKETINPVSVLWVHCVCTA